MDPSLAIVGLLAAAAKAATSAVATKGLVDAYEGLKRIFIDRTGNQSAVDEIVKEPESETAKTTLADNLAKSGALSDPTLLALAERLAAAMQQIKETDHSSARIDIKGIKAYHNVILRQISSTGGTTVGSIVAETGDAIVEGLSAGRHEKN